MAFTFVDKIEELADEFAAGFFFIKVDRFKHWAVVFDKSVSPANRAPCIEDVIPAGTIGGIKVAKTR